jgi:hypothetical protein
MQRSIQIAVVAVPLAATVGAMLWMSAYPAQKPLPTHATIVRMGPEQTRFGLRTAIVFRADDGRTGEDVRPTSEIACEIGDSVKAVTVGISLYLAADACLRLPSSPWAREPQRGRPTG